MADTHAYSCIHILGRGLRSHAVLFLLPVLIPPKELKVVIDKLAQFVIKNGEAFEQKVKTRQSHTARGCLAGAHGTWSHCPTVVEGTRAGVEEPEVLLPAARRPLLPLLLLSPPKQGQLMNQNQQVRNLLACSCLSRACCACFAL